ncbi:MAG: histidinol-phosphatase, partial [Eudoraea sp.]|nr:histidinol-phosphatase [Eudoraea sp.]
MKPGQKRRVLFIDRDGTIIKEPADEQIDAFEKLVFYPHVFTYLGKIAREMNYELVLVTNQDGLGTSAYPEETFWPVQDFVMNTLKHEGIVFSKVFIDKTFPEAQAPTRKPATGLLTEYFSEEYDLSESYVIGDRLTDIELAKNLGAKGIFINQETQLGINEIKTSKNDLEEHIALETADWKSIYDFLKTGTRVASYSRKTNETNISISLNLDGTGKSTIQTGLAFFDHMLDQLARHGQLDLDIVVEGDLEVDEH